MLVLLGLTACQVLKPLTYDSEYEATLLNLMPELPQLPDFPKVNWTFINGCYCLCESDTDLVLNYLENEIPTYQYGIKQYKDQMDIILKNFQDSLN